VTRVRPVDGKGVLADPVRTTKVSRDNGRSGPPFVMVASDAHRVHHVHDPTYSERPARAEVIGRALRLMRLFHEVPPRICGHSSLRAVHDPEYLRFLKTACQGRSVRDAILPYAFPIRHTTRIPRPLDAQAGYFALDPSTPLDANAWQAARAAVHIALTAAEQVSRGASVAYALCRPPGHHAERRHYGGFCYLNNTAVAAESLRRRGRVAVLDLDFHHGNGTQDIFWRRDDVLTLSIHGEPAQTYPHFSGFPDEIGEGPGRGFNGNYPLRLTTGNPRFLRTVADACRRIEAYDPWAVVVALGLDTIAPDPCGAFRVTAEAFTEVAEILASLRKPLLIVQEGGYNLRNLRAGITSLFAGLAGRVAPGAAPRTPV